MIEEKYKTFWSRFWAGWIDTLIFIPLMIIDHFIWKFFGQLPIIIVLIWYVTYYISFNIYSVLMHGKYGQTLGKMAMRVKVLAISEKPLTIIQAIKRDIVPILLTALGIYIGLPKIIAGINIYDSNVAIDASAYVIMFVVWRGF
jgi:uncharacterized RDD family membrane protein YckC